MDEAHRLKKTRLQWIEMIEQLRHGSPVAKEVEPGQCQDMLDFLVNRYWPFECQAPKLRFETNKLKLKQAEAADLFNALPNEEWARKERPPRSEENFPIFLKAKDRLIYLDGRRRINKWYREDANAIIPYWEIEVLVN